VEGLCKILPKIKIDEQKLTQHLKREFLKYRNLMKNVFGTEIAKQAEKKINITAYAQYLLKSGTRDEKRELLKCLKTKLLLENRMVRVEKITKNRILSFSNDQSGKWCLNTHKSHNNFCFL